MKTNKTLSAIFLVVLLGVTGTTKTISLNPLTWVASILIIFQKKSVIKVTPTIDSHQIQGDKKTQQDAIFHEKCGNENLIIAAITDGHGVDKEMAKNKDHVENAKKVFPNLKTTKDKEGNIFVDLGATIAEYVARTLPTRIAEKVKPGWFSWFSSFFFTKTQEDINKEKTEAMKESFEEVNKDLQEKFDSTEVTNLFEDNYDKIPRTKRAGTTAAVVVIDRNNNDVVFAHAGDSKIVAYDNEGKIVHETKDHTFKNEEENKRIKNEDKYTDKDGVGRFKSPSLMVTRSFGDFALISAGLKVTPTVSSFKLDKIQKILIGSDGIFDKFKTTNFSSLTKSKDIIEMVSDKDKKEIEEEKESVETQLSIVSLLAKHEEENTKELNDTELSKLIEQHKETELPKIFNHLVPVEKIDINSTTRSLMYKLQQANGKLKGVEGMNKKGSFKGVQALLSNKKQDFELQLKKTSSELAHDNLSAVLITFNKK